jgi:hypothetical protein
VTWTDAVLVPAADGEKVTVTVQVALTARVEGAIGQSLVWE